MSQGSPIEGFTKLSDTISIYRPKDHPDGALSPQDAPALIVICSWMGAATKHIAKYTTIYQSLYSAFTILLIQSDFESMAASDEDMVERLKPAVETILSFVTADSQHGKITLHAYSNGGGTVVTHLVLALKARLGVARAIKVFARVILECLPGRACPAQGAQAISYGLPQNFFAQRVGVWILWAGLHLYLLKCKLLGQEDMLQCERRRLNATATSVKKNPRGELDGVLWDERTPRLYMYTKADPVVGWRDIHDHVVESKENGFTDVEEEVFEKAPHCGLPREDVERYTNLIKDFIAGEN